MRIRRSASKLLGLATALPASPPRWAPSEPEASASAVAAFDVDAAAGAFCQLNCSPWDAMPNLQLAMFFQDEDEEGRGVPVHGFEVKEDEHGDLTANDLFPARSESNLTHEEEGMEDSEMAKKKKQKKQKQVNKSKGKNQVDKGRRAADFDSAVTCKKTDGKGWHCKRPAHHPHSLCQYHLSQLRNYGTAASTEPPASDSKPSTTRSRKKSNMSAAADDNFYYYYYSGFGPWRGKTRGGRQEVVEVDNGSGSSKNSECADVNEDSDAPVAGEDECAIDDDNEDDNGEGCPDVNYVEKNEEGKAKRKVKKRGRKPVKARSLKSLL